MDASVVQTLRQHCRHRLALRTLLLSAATGSVFELFGPNGAGMMGG